MLGLTFDKILVLGLLAAFVIGPSRLPDAAAQLGRFVRMVRRSLDGAKTSLRETGGPDLDDIDWKRLDPRQYDPRRIIRDALLEEPEPTVRRPSPAATTAPTTEARVLSQEEPAHLTASILSPRVPAVSVPSSGTVADPSSSSVDTRRG